MGWWRAFFGAVQVNRGRADRELEEEIQTHLELETEHQISAGLSPTNARNAALREFGSVALAKEQSRQVWGLGFLEEAWQDLRHGWRSLGKSTGFTAIAVITLGLAIGANTAIFSIVRNVLLRPLPFHDIGQLVEIQSLSEKSGEVGNWSNYRDVADWRQGTRSFVAIGASHFALLNHTEAGRPVALYGASVSSEVLPLLGVRPLLGRAFSPADDRVGQDRVIILSFSLWQKEFGSNPAVLGEKMHFTAPVAEDREIIGVMPADFNFPLNIPTAISPPSRQMAFWIPLGVEAAQENRERGDACLITARLRPGVTLAQAQADIDAVSIRLERDYPATNTGRRSRIIPFVDYIFGSARLAILLVWGATGLVILIGCANIANLMLARATNRRRETGIRRALGAGRARLIRQWLTESLLLAGLGGGVGLLLALTMLGLFISLAPADIPRLGETRLDITVLGFTAGITVLTGILSGLLPAWHAARTDPQEALKEAGPRSTHPGRS
ncbi:MAG TPA: ABC transporter permease, partial [Blastocatellia bacterium]|nr:ABC transporter permease [Blastocatellia bacterium]